MRVSSSRRIFFGPDIIKVLSKIRCVRFTHPTLTLSSLQYELLHTDNYLMNSPNRSVILLKYRKESSYR